MANGLIPRAILIKSIERFWTKVMPGFAQNRSRGTLMLDNLTATSAPARTLGEFACGLTFEHIPAAVLERAKLLILDALGFGIASNAYGFFDGLLAGATALGELGGCSVIGRANRLPV